MSGSPHGVLGGTNRFEGAEGLEDAEDFEPCARTGAIASDAIAMSDSVEIRSRLDIESPYPGIIGVETTERTERTVLQTEERRERRRTEGAVRRASRSDAHDPNRDGTRTPRTANGARVPSRFGPWGRPAAQARPVEPRALRASVSSAALCE